MRSMNQSFGNTNRKFPNAIIQRSLMYKPYKKTGSPAPDNPLRKLAIFMWCSGIDTKSCCKNILSPNVPFEAQLSVEAGGLKARGLYQIQNKLIAINISEYAPIYSLDHIDKDNRGKQVNLE